MIFKLLAVRLNSSFPLKKNLREKQFYKFSNDFQFLDKEGKNLETAESYTDIINIRDLQSFPGSLYSLDQVNPTKEKNDITAESQKYRRLDINISAIVGQNGAGKSSLLEIFYLFIFCISESKDFINHKAGIESEFRGEEKRGIRELLENNRKVFLQSTDVELYYRLGNDSYVVRRTKGDTLKYSLDAGKWQKKDWEETDFFYTIAVNYSQYGLNAQWDYYWLRPLFHKNDGYRTPLVLNPFRDKGNIDINRENHLAQIRLLTNLSHEQFESSVLIDDKSIDSVTFFVRPGLNGIINGVGENSNQSVTLMELASRNAESQKKTLIDFFEALLELFDPTFKNRLYYDLLISNLKSFLNARGTDTGLAKLSDTVNLKSFLNARDTDTGLAKLSDKVSAGISPNALRLQLAIYILIKAIKICNKYSVGLSSVTEQIDITRKKVIIRMRTVKNASGLAKRLFFNQSHVTLKLRQAVNVLVNENFVFYKWESIPDEQAFGYLAFKAIVPFQEVRKATQDSFNNATYEKKHLSHFVPGAFFTPGLTISSPSGKFLFSQMSSGEQQLIHSVHSVLYHMLNLDSIHSRKGPNGKKLPEQYSFVNVILDEIELYYHPLYQRQFVKFLRESIRNMNLRFIEGINILFSTHSPFILSDIPGVNVLRLEKGQPARFNQEETFGANIHDMLADSFFMGDSLIGQFAEEKINECISYINEVNLLKDIALPNLNLVTRQKITATYTIPEAQRRLKLLQPKIGYESYDQAVRDERETKKIYSLIQLSGEQVIRHKLLEMYDAAMLNVLSDQDAARRQVLEILRQNNLNIDDL
jgi:AAA15 family ATPase/GTPase